MALAKLGAGSPPPLRGRFARWEDARRASAGYDSPIILERVAASVQKLLEGGAAYERDSVTFSEIPWPWPLLAALGRQATRDAGALRVLDFGGSLGSTYLVARRFFGAPARMQWHIVEQPHFARRGAQLALPGAVAFFDAIAPAVGSFAPNVTIASGVLHYLPKPLDVLHELASIGADTLIIDRTPCISEPDDVIAVQHVPPDIFPASYPSWLFSRDRIPNALRGLYSAVASFEAPDQLRFDGKVIQHRGWLFERCAGSFKQKETIAP